MLCDEKKELIETNLENHHLPDPFVREDPREEIRIITVLWVLVLCLLYFVTYGLHRKNSINSHKVVAERFVLLL